MTLDHEDQLILDTMVRLFADPAFGPTAKDIAGQIDRDTTAMFDRMRRLASEGYLEEIVGVHTWTDVERYRFKLTPKGQTEGNDSTDF